MLPVMYAIMKTVYMQVLWIYVQDVVLNIQHETFTNKKAINYEQTCAFKPFFILVWFGGFGLVLTSSISAAGSGLPFLITFHLFHLAQLLHFCLFNLNRCKFMVSSCSQSDICLLSVTCFSTTEF